ncbi:MAG TPA: alpha/beta fold hydrolase [Actinocrinis sp.]|uniref:alpha/beta fold hydrolase n=1 Tax=Actinocrinis sp. TaxID=1920516 RepID=UPI002D3D7E5B|nr:alpha/beta fold hydrolase [Actinocrinis sp.]HZU58763.1 alpha/beta fold hydrolase [Actinocrinis sp.]
MHARSQAQSSSQSPAAAGEALGAFDAVYDTLIARWGVPVEAIDVPSRFGTTRLNACGPRDAPPLVLLHGGRSNSASWYANAAALSRSRRVYAPDTIGDPGRSPNTGQPVRTRQDLLDWLTHLLNALEIQRADVCGHSFGAWLALAHTLRAPRGSIGRLALLDPTQCFAGFAPACLWHALPGMLRPARGDDAYLRWETRGAEFDPDWLALHRLSATVPTGKIIAGRRPKQSALQALDVPVLVLLAERSRVHNVDTVAKRASRTLPNVTVDTLPAVSHHMIPFAQPETLNRKLTEFFTSAG